MIHYFYSVSIPTCGPLRRYLGMVYGMGLLFSHTNMLPLDLDIPSSRMFLYLFCALYPRP